MKKSDKFWTILSIIAVFSFFIIMIIIEKHKINNINDCTETIRATVINTRSEEYENNDGYTYYNYYSTYQYKYGENVYTKESSSNDKHKHDNIGEIVTIYVNPNNPEILADEYDKSSSNILYYVYIVGFILSIIIVVFVSIICLKKDKKETLNKKNL